jgi:hypothetical protein
MKISCLALAILIQTSCVSASLSVPHAPKSEFVLQGVHSREIVAECKPPYMKAGTFLMGGGVPYSKGKSGDLCFEHPQEAIVVGAYCRVLPRFPPDPELQCQLDAECFKAGTFSRMRTDSSGTRTCVTWKAINDKEHTAYVEWVVFVP